MTHHMLITKEDSLEFHKLGNKPGKYEIHANKPLVSQYDLSLAYSPGVAYPCLEIHENPSSVYEYTNKGNMVAVISNGTAVLGLGNLGASASKPVMEGKAVLFKKFADINAIDIEVSTEDPEKFINAIRYLGDSWGGINLEDIKAPECFIIEQKLNELMDIPVFHDDQHGTAIITLAGLMNAAYITKKSLETIKIVVNGAGSAGIACIDLIKLIGVPSQNIILCDTKGVIYKGRTEGMNEWKLKHATETNCRTLAEAMVGADFFLGLSAKGAVSAEMVKSMAASPIIFALANPDPEITPEEILSVRSDAIIATGRSDYNNQVNNVMGFPYIFRGALDVRAKTINNEMKLAAANALAELARQPVPEQVYKAYSRQKMQFGPDYIIPVPFDPRLIQKISLAVAEAAIATGVARIKDFDIEKYKNDLKHRLDPTSNYMSLIYEQAQTFKQRILFAEGEEEETIKAAIMMSENEYADPILIGRENKIMPLFEKLGHLYNSSKIKIVNAATTNHLNEYIDSLYSKLQRQGYLYRDIARLVKSDRNIFAACMLARNDGDALITGLNKGYLSCLEDIVKVIPPKPDHLIFSYSILLTKERNIIISDCSVNELPTAEELANIAIQTAQIAKNMGYKPRVALLSFSNFGNPMRDKAMRVREAVDILEHRSVDFEFEGEMCPDVALNANLMKLYPFCRLSAPANVLIMPALHSSSISTKLLQELGDGRIIGPILTGFTKPVQIVPLGSDTKDIINLATFAAIESISKKQLYPIDNEKK